MRRRNERLHLIVTELAVVALLLTMSAVLSPSHRVFRLLSISSGNGVTLFLLLFLLSLATAWHEVSADHFYHDRLRPRLRRFYDAPRLFVSQSMVVVTYGVLIILVGTLQVLSRSIFVSWATACLLTAGVVGLFVLWHLVSPSKTDKEEVRILPPHYPSSLLSPLLFFFFLPQALMFHTRVLFLLAPVEQGGLARSLQELGFVHGVIGALGFSIGLVVSRRFVRRRMRLKDVARRKVRYSQYALPSSSRSFMDLLNVRMLLRFLPLLLSPVVYCVMSYCPPTHLWQLGVCTFLAQFLFGYGMHRLLSFLGLPASIGLRVPVVAAYMLVPMALSGWLVGVMGFRSFFLMDALTACLPLLGVLFCKRYKVSSSVNK